jgi:hypothetical protein
MMRQPSNATDALESVFVPEARFIKLGWLAANHPISDVRQDRA